MSKTKKTTFKAFDYMHCDDFARYLEDMAAKGWHFTEWGAGLKFEKGEPEKAKYAVEVFTKASENDLRPEPNTQEFAEYCEAAGWRLIDAKQKFCVFKKMDDNATEILTSEERVRNSFKATFSVSYILLLFLYGLNAVLQWINMFRFFSDSVFSVMGYFNVAIWSILFITTLVKFVYALVKRHKLLKQIKYGQKIYIGSNPDGKKRLDIAWTQWFVFFTLFVLMILMLENSSMKMFLVIVFVATLLFSILLAKFRPDASTSVAIQVIFTVVFFFIIIISSFTILSGNKVGMLSNQAALEKVPLKISDYRKFQDVIEDVSVYHEKNMLGSSEKYFVFGEKESIHYEIYRTEYDWILDHIWKDEVEKKRNENIIDCTKEWDADIAFRNKIGEYYVRYDDALLIFSEDEDIVLDSEQISIIRDKLELR